MAPGRGQGRRSWRSSPSQSNAVAGAATPGVSHAPRTARAAPVASHAAASQNAGPTPGAHRSMSRGVASTAGAPVVSSSTPPLQATATSLPGRKVAKAEVRTCFYPKLENRKSYHEIMDEMKNGSTDIEVSLKHSGCLFMYSGRHGGAYAETNFGNLCTTVGIVVLERSFRQAWGNEASTKMVEFSNYLTSKSIAVSMELVAEVLGDHGQRPKHDYVVVTAVTKFVHGKPRFYSTADMIDFCRTWRLPSNHVWLFSRRASVKLFFETYAKLCEEGTATNVCDALDDIADIIIPGSEKYSEAQGEILEGVLVRAVSNESSVQLSKLLQNAAETLLHGSDLDLGPSVRQICDGYNSDSDKIKALRPNASILLDWSEWQETSRIVILGFLEALPVDDSTRKLQNLINLMKEQDLFPASFKCYQNRNSISPVNQNLSYKMLICVDDIKQYQQKRVSNPGLWPLYRGFFVDINQYTDNNWRAPELSEDISDGLVDVDLYPMLKLKFLPFKLRTVLIRDGLPTLIEHGPYAYKAFYKRQMRDWGTSRTMQRKLTKLLEKWSDHIIKKYGTNQPPSKTYLEEAEPFLERYSDMIDSEGEQDESPETEGFIVFFTGMPGCGNSALCNEILKQMPGCFKSHPLHFISETTFEGEYWENVADEQKRNLERLTLTDKNAPTEGLWCQIEDICQETKAAAIPIIPDSEGTESNPFSLQCLAVLMFRVFKQGNSDNSFDADQVLKFYHLYEGKDRGKFEDDLRHQFGSIVKMPLLKPERDALPSDLQHALNCGISLFRLQQQQQNCGSMPTSQQSNFANDWSLWKTRMLKALSENEEYLNSIQVPISIAAEDVLNQLKRLFKKRKKQIRRRRKEKGKGESKEASSLYSSFRLLVSTTVVLFLLYFITYFLGML